MSCGRVPEKSLGHRPSFRTSTASQPACPPAQQFIWLWSSILDTDLRSCDPPADRTPGTGTNTFIHPSIHPPTSACFPRLRYMPACLRKHTYIPTLGTYIHTRTYVHMCTQIHTPTHTSPCPVNQTNVIMPCSGMQGHPSRPSDQQREAAGIYGLTPVGCLSETSSPCRTAQDPHPQSHAINKGSIKAPAFALPLASRTGSPTHTLKRLGSLAPWSPQSLQRVGQTASAPSAISNLHAAGSHAA